MGNMILTMTMMSQCSPVQYTCIILSKEALVKIKMEGKTQKETKKTMNHKHREMEASNRIMAVAKVMTTMTKTESGLKLKEKVWAIGRRSQRKKRTEREMPKLWSTYLVKKQTKNMNLWMDKNKMERKGILLVIVLKLMLCH